jgi:predicted HTH domain antitoxin
VRISKTKLSRSLNFSLWISNACYLEHIAPIVIFSIYSIELELHDRKVYLRTYVRV